MNKQEFLDQLKYKLSGLSESDIEERLNFYGELIDDMIEEGSTEAEAISSIGSVDDIASQIISEASSAKKENEDENLEIRYKKEAKEAKKKRKLKTWEIVLLAVGAPLWVPLLISAIVVIISLYISLWSVVISLWAVFGSLIGGAIGSVIAFVAFICQGQILPALAILSLGLACAGLSIFMFFGCKAATKGTVALAKLGVRCIKRMFSDKEGA